jgi:tRNA pseudouridine38-40 synthase
MSTQQHRVRLDVAYDGAPFRGFAENADVRTVAGDLRAALERVLGQSVVLTCAGRTDAGVHARGQVVTLDVTGPPPEPTRLRDALNALVGPTIVVRGVQLVADDLDARFSACWRRYRYLVLNAEVPDPFCATTAWWVREPLDVGEMNRAALAVVGEHDFSSFCRGPRGEEEASLVRRVHLAGWTAQRSSTDLELLRFEIAASAFCHQMVRSIVGALVRVGRGRMDADQVARLLAARDRSGAPNLAPPHGLVLWEVGYEPWG